MSPPTSLLARAVKEARDADNAEVEASKILNSHWAWLMSQPSVSLPPPSSGLFELVAPMTGAIVKLEGNLMTTVLMDTAKYGGIIIHNCDHKEKVIVAPISGMLTWDNHFHGFVVTNYAVGVQLQVGVYIGQHGIEAKDFQRIVNKDNDKKTIVQRGQAVAVVWDESEESAIMIIPKGGWTKKLEFHKWRGETTAGMLLYHMNEDSEWSKASWGREDEWYAPHPPEGSSLGK